MNAEVRNSLFLVPCLPAGKGRFDILLVRIIGVEPTWIAPPDPKSGASANFAISASPLRLLLPEAGQYPLTGGKIKDFILKKWYQSKYYFTYSVIDQFHISSFTSIQ